MRDPIVRYFPDTDTMGIDLSDEPSVEANEIATNVIVAVDKDGVPVAVEFLGPVHEIFADLIEGVKHAGKQQKRAAS
ncbi:MAG: DUF2283 domain-containing protein [Dehalococcoidia bacterium]